MPSPTLADIIGDPNNPTPNPPVPPVIVPPVDPASPIPPADAVPPVPPVDPNNSTTPVPPVDPNAPPVDPNAPPVDPNAPVDDDEMTPEDFFQSVDALRGIEIFKHVEYEDVDPMSPEGFKMRDEYLEARAVQEFDNSLKDSDPRAYAYFLHRQSGGSDEDFFQVKSFVLPAIDKVEESVDLQRSVYSEALKAKGVPDKQIQVLIKASIDGGELKEDAKAAWKEISDRDKALAASTSQQHELSTKRQKADIDGFANTIAQVIKEGKDFNFTIPEADKAKFEAAFKQNLFYDNGQFYVMKAITRENLPKIMETELFGFVGGKLGSLIEKQATTLSARRFISKAKAAEDKSKGQQQQTTTKTLGEL